MSKNRTENLPPKFIENISGLYGAKGEKWLADLPQIIREISGKWSLEIDRVFSNLSFNFVALCVDEAGEKCVLKIGVPEKDSSILFEKRALEAFDGKGAVKLLKFDEKLCAMLLERAIAGKTLSEVCGEDYAKAVEIAVEVMKKLPRNPPDKSKFINLESWTDGLNRAAKANFELEKVGKAQKFFDELVEPFERKILLHGDIHFDNILSARREPFLLIDPKGVVGEIGYEIAVFLNDLAGWTEHLPDQKVILASAVKSFSRAFKVGIDDLRKWAYAFAVLSAWWAMEDFGKDWEGQILRADIWEV
ncbi:MAG: aminoglycoside phosphotransferase family protein [Pyrinomonadaceae bacterium]